MFLIEKKLNKWYEENDGNIFRLRTFHERIIIFFPQLVTYRCQGHCQ